MKYKFLDRETLEIFVKGGLKNCIDAHGPIDFGWVDSAAKRIIGQITPEIEDWVQDTRAKTIDNLRREIREIQTENRLLRDRLNKKRIFEHKRPISLHAGLEEFLK